MPTTEPHVSGILTAYSRELLDDLPDPAVVLDAQDRIVYLNHAAEHGFSDRKSGSLVGSRFSAELLFGPGASVSSDADLDLLPGFDSGDVPHVRHITVQRPNAGRLLERLDYLPLHSELGSIAGMGVVFHDETVEDARRSEAEWLRKELLESRREVERELQTSQRLLEAADHLRSWTRLGDIAPGIAELLLSVTPHARAVVGMCDADTEDLVVEGSAGSAPPVALERRGRPKELDAALQDVFDTHASVLVDLESPGTECRESNLYGARRMLITPLLLHGRVLGVLTLDDPGELGEFDQRQTRLVEAIAAQASVAIENARLYQAEHRIAETLQETLVVLPSHVPGIAFSRAYESASSQSGRVGGDFVDVFDVRNNRVAISLGDVAGKGIDAAVITSLVRTTLRVHAVDGLTPVEIVSKTNKVIGRFTELESFVSVWFGVLDTRSGVLRYVSAGHPPAFVMPRDGAMFDLRCGNPVLGAFDESEYEECQTTLNAGDRLIIYSDGLTEARNPQGEFLREKGLKGIVRAHRNQDTAHLCAAIMGDIITFSHGVLRDDAAVLAVEPVKLHARVEDDGQLRAFL